MLRYFQPAKIISNYINYQLYRKMSIPSKSIKPFIGTHDNTFHCDDVTACYMLKLLDRFKDHDIVRTRDQKILDEADIVVDVGSVLDVEKLRLDHHQRSFNQTIRDYHPEIKTTNPEKPPRLSSSGLVFAIFGKAVIMKLLNLDGGYEELNMKDKKMVDAVYNKSYIEFFEEIDAIDNGVEIASGDNIKYNYHINSGISTRVKYLNPLDNNATPDERLVQFRKAMDLVGSEISRGIVFLAREWWPTREYYRDLVMKRKEFDPSGQIVLFEGEHMIGFKSAMFDLEEELGINGEIKYVIYPQSSSIGKRWRALGLSVDLKSFTTRVPLKEEWRGKRDEELQKVSGIPDATFVHMSGFTGGAGSLEGIKSMVRKTLGLE